MDVRWFNKANAFAAAWKSKFGVQPSLPSVVLGLSVAQHETHCGDSWPGEFNWGAVQHRVPNTDEKKVIEDAGLHPDPKQVGGARDALKAAIDTGTLPAPDHCALHVDSSPGKGWYWVFFWAFSSDEEGAGFFIHILVEKRASCEAILEKTTTDLQGAAAELAAAMYATHYYEGFHDPKKEGGAQANIDDYAHSLQAIIPGIMTGLNGWAPGATIPPPDPNAVDLTTLAGLQAALNKLGADPQLVVDGKMGPATTAAVKAFQGPHGLTADGLVGPKTISALTVALG